MMLIVIGMNKGTGLESRAVTAAVSVENGLVDENQSLGNWEGRVRAQREDSFINASQKTYEEGALCSFFWNKANTQEYGCDVIVTVFFYGKNNNTQVL